MPLKDLLINFNYLMVNSAPLVLIIIIILIFSCIYVLLYNYLDLYFSLASYVYFFIFMLIFSLYIYAIIFTYCGNPDPIYLENFYEYKNYGIVILMVLLGLFRFIPYLHTLTFLKKEVQILLDIWARRPLIAVGFAIFHALDSSVLFRVFYFFLHFLLFIFTRVVVTIMFFGFVFLHQDLRVLLYLLPLYLFIWLLSFFDYCLYIYLTEFIKEILEKYLTVAESDGIYQFSLPDKTLKNKELLSISGGSGDLLEQFTHTYLKYLRLKTDFDNYTALKNYIYIILGFCQTFLLYVIAYKFIFIEPLFLNIP